MGLEWMIKRLVRNTNLSRLRIRRPLLKGGLGTSDKRLSLDVVIPVKSDDRNEMGP
jgi:hypothetical protein